MSNTKKIASVAFTGVAAAGMAGFAAAPAFAATTIRITSGTGHTPVANNTSYSATATNAKLVDTTHPVSLKCTTASTSGVIPLASPTTSNVATVAGATFKTCTFLTVDFGASLTQGTDLYATTANASGASGHIGAAATPIRAKLKGTNIACSATISGNSIPAKYVDKNHSLSINNGDAATLTINNVTTLCPTLKDGDAAYFAGNFKVTTPTSLSINS